MAREQLPRNIRKARHSWLVALVAQRADNDLQEFGKKVGIDRSTVSLLFHDHREVTDKYAVRISNRLKVDPPGDMALQPVAQPIAAPSTYGCSPSSVAVYGHLPVDLA